MNTSKCFLCGSSDYEKIHAGVRDNPNIDVLKCKKCGLVRLSKFRTDFDEYYVNSLMRANDAEKNLKEIRNAAMMDDTRRAQFLRPMIENKSFLDFGCGGGCLIQCQSLAKEVYGVELEAAMCNSLQSEGIKCFPSIEVACNHLKNSVDVISLFHVLEHLENPIETLEKLKTLLTPNGIIVIEVPNADDALLSLYDCKAFSDFTYWECHLFLYNNKTFSELMRQSGLKIRFLSQIQRYSLSNTLYWLSKGKPGGHKHWRMLSTETLDKLYGEHLASLGIADTIMAIVEPK